MANPNPVKDGMVAVMHYFDIPATQFRKEWAELSDSDKTALKTGIGQYNTDTKTATGSLTY